MFIIVETTLLPNSSRSRRTDSLSSRPQESALQKSIERNRAKTQGQTPVAPSNELTLQQRIELKKRELLAKRSATNSLPSRPPLGDSDGRVGVARPQEERGCF